MHPAERICVIGAGRIGLPISVTLADRGCLVHVLERDQDRVSMVNSASAPFFEEGMSDALANAVHNGNLVATTDYSVIADCNVIISAVGTGVLEDGTPDIGSIDSLVKEISPHLNEGDLLLVKTTVPLGTTDKIASMLESESGLEIEKGILVAFSPERIVEGRAMEELTSLPKIVGGVGPNSTKRAMEVMSIFGGKVIEVSNSKTAELCKLLDNAYRMTRFGFSSDVAAVSWRNGINAIEAIKAANDEYPRNSIPLPAVGVSGYCLTKDPYYLDAAGFGNWVDRGFPSTWITARKAADLQIIEAISRIQDRLGQQLSGKVIVVAGVTYKEDVDDIRHSHGREIIKELRDLGGEVRIWDPCCKEEVVDGIEVSRSAGVVRDSDCLIITVPHNEFLSWSESPRELEEMNTKLVFDGWGIFFNKKVPENLDIIGIGF
jgi:UDP-N-acetyl-D-mannosaminuronic acid dehydrogenase